MDMVYETEQKIRMAIYYNSLIDYLEGVGVYKICSDPRDRQSLHAFNFSMECYNKYAARCPQLELDRRFSEELILRLKSDKCYVYEVYYIFNCPPRSSASANFQKRVAKYFPECYTVFRKHVESVQPVPWGYGF